MERSCSIGQHLRDFPWPLYLKLFGFILLVMQAIKFLGMGLKCSLCCVNIRSNEYIVFVKIALCRTSADVSSQKCMHNDLIKLME